jgi:excisionase family DNA binding protein
MSSVKHTPKRSNLRGIPSTNSCSDGRDQTKMVEPDDIADRGRANVSNRNGLIKTQPLLTVADIANRLGIRSRTVYAMVAQRRIPFRKPPGTNLLRFDPEEYLEWENGNSSK